MFRVFCDNYLLYDTAIDALVLNGPKLSLALNCVSSFEFTIYPNHPHFDKIQKLKSFIRVYEDGKCIFRGRVLSDRNGFNNEKFVSCESDMAFLIDSIQRPYNFEGTPADLFRYLINTHNAQVDDYKKFKIGRITVTDPNNYINRSDSTYQNTFEAISEKLISGLGGYIWIRYEEDGNYIDYLEDFNVLASQRIEFGSNLLSFSRTVNANDIFTVIIPLGASDEDGNRLDIKAVNDGKDYLEHSEGISKYGRITKMVEWDDVTIANNLKTKAQKMLDNAVLLINQIELTAADLGAINQDINTFKLGTKVRVISKPNKVDDYYLVNKLEINLLNPAANVLSLGAEFKSFTDKTSTDKKTIANQIETKTEQVKHDAIVETSKQFQSELSATSESILATVSENHYLKGETDEMISSVNTSLEQTANSFEFQFNNFSKDIENMVNGTDAQFENISKYIRFEDGKILIGEVGNSLELQIDNDRIRFIQDGTEVAYFSNNKLFVTDGEYTNSLQLGKFAFLPRTSGNLSFKKVRD